MKSRRILGPLVMGAGLLAACTGWSGNQPVGTTSSAISPEEAINPVSYTFALTSVGVVNAWNAYNSGPYVEYAAVGASTQPFGSGSPATVANPIQGCSLGAIPPGTDYTGGPTPQFYLTKCVSETTGQAPAGTALPVALQQTVTLNHETDVANFAVVLDNIGSTDPTTLADNSFGAQLGLATSALGTEGTIISVAAGIATLGGATASVGAVALVAKVVSLVAPLFDPGPSTITPCSGGLIGNPADPGGVPAKPGAYDTLYYSYSAAQLEALTNATGTGSVTITTPVSVNWPTTLKGDVAGMCDSAHVINVTITRVPGTGPAAYPLSGSTGVARTATELDAIVADPARNAMAQIQGSAATGWQTSLATASTYSPGNYAPTATVSRQVPPAGSQLTVVPPVAASGSTPATPGTTNLQGTIDSFWFDTTGELKWSEWLPGAGWATGGFGGNGIPNVASSRLTATARTPSVTDVFWVNSQGGLTDFTLPAELPTQANPNVGAGDDTNAIIASAAAPAGASVAAISRTYDSEDVLYIGNNGALYDVSYTLARGWGAPQMVGQAGMTAPGAFVTAVARDANSVDAFFTGGNGAVYWARYFNAPANGFPGGVWQAPQALPGATGSAGAPITAVSRSAATIDLVYFESNRLEYTSYDPTGAMNWSAPVQLTTDAVNPETDLSLVAPDDNDLALFYQDVVNNTFTATWNATAGTWQVAEPAIPAGIGIIASPLQVTVQAGSSATVALDVTGPSGLTVALTESGSGDLDTQFTSASVATGGTSDLYISVPGSVTADSASLTVTGSANGLSYSVPIEVTITPCVPYTCAEYEATCGTLTNGCGGTMVCGPACAPPPKCPVGEKNCGGYCAKVCE